MASKITVILEDDKMKLHQNSEAEIANGFLVVKTSAKHLVIYPEHRIKRVDVVDNG